MPKANKPRLPEHSSPYEFEIISPVEVTWPMIRSRNPSRNINTRYIFKGLSYSNEANCFFGRKQLNKIFTDIAQWNLARNSSTTVSFIICLSVFNKLVATKKTNMPVVSIVVQSSGTNLTDNRIAAEVIPQNKWLIWQRTLLRRGEGFNSHPDLETERGVMGWLIRQCSDVLLRGVPRSSINYPIRISQQDGPGKMIQSDVSLKLVEILT